MIMRHRLVYSSVETPNSKFSVFILLTLSFTREESSSEVYMRI